MSPPRFTGDERYLIEFYKSGPHSQVWSGWVVHTVLYSAFAWGFFHEIFPVMFVAVGVQLCLYLQDQWRLPAHLRTMQSLIQKYEDHIQELSSPGTTDKSEPLASAE